MSVLRLAVGVLVGFGATLRTPLWIEGPRLAELLRAPASSRPGAAAPPKSVGAAWYLLSLLARLPRSPWRNTCLYRSVSECLVLRRFGVPAVVRVGVRSEEGDIAAHAWVVRADAEGGEASTPSPEGHQPLVLRA